MGQISSRLCLNQCSRSQYLYNCQRHQRLKYRQTSSQLCLRRQYRRYSQQPRSILTGQRPSRSKAHITSRETWDLDQCSPRRRYRVRQSLNQRNAGQGSQRGFSVQRQWLFSFQLVSCCQRRSLAAAGQKPSLRRDLRIWARRW